MEPLARPGCNTLTKSARLVNSLAGRLVTLFLLAPCGGCMMGDQEPIRSMKEIVKAYDQLSKTLETVQDPESASAATPQVDAGFKRLNGLMASLPALAQKYKHKTARPDVLEKIQSDVLQATKRFGAQVQRLRTMHGLPVEFWSVVRTRSIEFAIASRAAAQVGGNRAPMKANDPLRITSELLAKHGHEQVVSVELMNLSPKIVEKAFEKLQRAAPNATLYHVSARDKHEVIMAPVDDFDALIKAVDFGHIVFQDPPQRKLAVEVDRRKLGMRANSDAEERALQKLDSDKKWQRWEREREEREARDEAERRERELRERKPQPEDPDYHEQLAERMLSASHFDQEEIIDALLLIEPSEVKSKDTRKKIARGFKEIAFDGHGSRQEKAIRGLVIWGGKYSVPILLQLLEKSGFFAEEEVYRALGDLKDARAAGPVAARLGDFSDHDEAYQCLRRMGPAAEEALIEVAPSNNAKVSLAAIELLSEVGTKKSNTILRKAERSRNPRVRSAAKKARERIRRREKEQRKD